MRASAIYRRCSLRSKLLVPSLLVAVLGVAACGSSKSSSSSSKSASSSSASSTPAAPTTTKGKIPSRTYSVKLVGKVEVPKGAPSGGGNAIVTIHGSTHQVCWRFAHLHGFTNPTFAHIHKGPAGTEGPIVVPFSTGPTFKHKGCVPASPQLLTAIEKNPHAYYVNIHSKTYPGGAVRSQL